MFSVQCLGWRNPPMLTANGGLQGVSLKCFLNDFSNNALYIYICHYMVLLTPLGPQHHYCICSMSTCPGKDPIQSGWHQISFPQSDSIRLCLCISANLALLECVKPQHQHSTQSHLRLQTVNSPHMANPCLLLQFPNANSSWIVIPATKKQTF